MPLDLKGRLFLPSKHKFKADEDVDYGDNWRALEGWSRPVWRKLTLVNAWVDATTVFAAFLSPSFCIDGFGWVHIQGLTRNMTTTAIPTTISTLPVGFRPTGQVGFSTITSFGTGGVGQISARIDIQSNGNIIATPPPVGQTIDFLFLDCIHFSTIPITK